MALSSPARRDHAAGNPRLYSSNVLLMPPLCNWQLEPINQLTAPINCKYCKNNISRQWKLLYTVNITEFSYIFAYAIYLLKFDTNLTC